MSRIPLIAVEDMTAEQLARYERFPSNLSRSLLLADARLAACLPATANALRASALDPKLREAAILRVAALSGSAYERMQHLEQAKKAGWTSEEISRIEAGDTALPEDIRLVIRFVDECVKSVKVSDETFAMMRDAVSVRDLATLILLVGHYMTVARLLETLEVELDPAPDAWTSEH